MDGGVRLTGKKVLIVEDQYMIADDLAGLFSRLDATVVGPCARSEDAKAVLATQRVDFAVLDIALADNAVYPLARDLRERRVPFVFLTGFSGDGVAPEFADAPILVKPYSDEALLRLITRLGWLGAAS